MRPSHPIVVVGVGVVVSLFSTAPGYSQKPDANAVPAESAEPSPAARSEKIDESTLDRSDFTQSGSAIASPLKTQDSSLNSSATPRSGLPGSKKPSHKKISAPNKAAQVIPVFTPEPATGTTPASVIPTRPVSPTFQTLPFQSIPLGPAKPGAAPEYLNPNPNPLSFPTRPEEVKLRGIQPITLKQALELAKRNNRELQSAIAVLDRARAALREAQAARYPTVSANGQISQSQSASGQLARAAQEQAQQALPPALRQDVGGDRQSTALNGTVQVGYDIYTSGRRPAQIRAVEQQVRSEELQVETTQQQLQLDVSNAYYNLQDADESVRIQQSAVRNAEASLRDSAALLRAGIGTRLDLLRAQVQLANAQQSLVTALGTQQIRRRELAQILALPPYLNLAAADPVQVAGVWDMSLEQSIVTAFKNRAELEQFLAQRAASEQRKKVALASLGPTVSLNVQYNILNDLRDDFGFADGFSAALGFQWNIFDGGAARAQASQQDANISQAEINFANTREQIQLQVETAYTNLGTNFLNIDTNRQAVEQAREALRLARLRFQAGVGTQTEVINTENDLTRAEGNLVTAILNYNRALASLTRSITNLPIPIGATTPTLPKPVTESTPPGGIPNPSPR
jgi:OMF family outer membrane factor